MFQHLDLVKRRLLGATLDTKTRNIVAQQRSNIYTNVLILRILLNDGFAGCSRDKVTLHNRSLSARTKNHD